MLVPSARTQAGHRLYRDADVRRLYRIAALRELGMSLAEVRETLDEGAELGDVLRAHLAHVERALAHETALHDRLSDLCARVEGGISTEDLITTIEGMAMQERYFTKQQLDALAKRRDELGEEAIRRRSGSGGARGCAARRLGRRHPASAPVQALAQHARELLHAFTGGDPEMYASLRRMRENEDALSASRGSWTAT